MWPSMTPPTRVRGSTRSTCSRTRAGTCTWATPRRSAAATWWRATTRCGATTSCIRSGGTLSGCRPRTPRSSAASRRGPWTYANIEQQAASFKRMGMSFDWSRRLNTCDPDYYRWTQWLFLRLFERGLAYRKESPVNWCPKDATVLANEQVIEGACERCGTMVERRNLTQWFFKITDYAQRLLDDAEALVDWPERVLTMQRNWIGRSEGAEVTFTIAETRREDHDLHDAARHAVGRDVLRLRDRAPGGPAAGRAGRHVGRRSNRWRASRSRRRWSIARPPTPARASSSACTP